MKIAVFLPNWVGDLVMATPTLRALRQQFPDAEIIGIVKMSVAPVLDEFPHLDALWPWREKSLIGSLRLVSRLRGFDRAILLTNSARAAQLAWLARIPQRIGYDRYRRARFLTTALAPEMYGSAFKPVSTLDYYLALATSAGCRDLSPRMELATTASDEAAFEKLDISPGFICLNNSGAFGPAKLWPDEHCAALARRLAESHAVLILCGPAERESAARIARLAEHPRVTSLADAPLSLGLTKSVIRHCRLLVSTDSGPRHIAAAFDRPVVTLFGPTAPAWSDTQYARETRLQLALECVPCQQRECPLGHHRCLRDLSVETVFAAAQPWIDASSATVVESP